MSDQILTDSQWEIVAPLISNITAAAQVKRPRGRPRKHTGRPLASDRAVLEGIIFVISNHISWMKLPPQRFPSFSTCHRRYLIWLNNGTWETVLNTLVEDLQKRTGVNLWQVWSKFITRFKAGFTYTAFKIPDNAQRTHSDWMVVQLFINNLKAIVRDDNARRIRF